MHVTHKGVVLKAFAKVRPSLAVWLILLLPVLLKLPVITGHITIDPIVYTASVGDTINFHGSYPWIDPNVGFQAQALGQLSADTLLHGRMPWWNPYNGVGLPLAAEAQPASLFLPFVLLHHFKSGFMWVQIILQIIAGLCTYGLLKKLRLTELAATTGGLLYELNGTFAWLGLPITGPIAFLPMLLLGTECLLQRVNDNRSGGWWLISVALAWSIYSGFPETAYIDGLFVALWVVIRLPDVESGARLVYMRNLVLAVCVGVACSFLQILPFAHYVPLAVVGAHDGSFSQVHLPPDAAALTLVPGLFGPIFRFGGPANAVSLVWDNIGGYVPVLQFAVLFLAIQLRPKRIVLAPIIWIVLCLGKTFGIRPVSDLLNMLPLVKMIAFYRYSPPSWELAAVLLVGIGVDAVQRSTVSRHRQSILAMAAAMACVLGAGWLAWPTIVGLKADHASAHYLRVAIAGLIVTLSACLIVLLMARRWAWAPRGVAALLVLDAALAFVAPLHSGVSKIGSDHGGLNYLRGHIGLQRTYTLGPMAPNYGAYFKIAQINHNYLPLSSDWAKYVKEHLDPGAEVLLFTGGNRVQGFGSAAEQLQARLPAYEEAGVKYVLAPHGVDPLAKAIDMPSGDNSYHAPLQLGSGHPVVLHWQISPQSYARSIRAVSLVLGNYNGRSDGQLNVEICQDHTTCVQGRRALSESTDNTVFVIPLEHDLVVGPAPQGSTIPLTISFDQSQQSFPVALWINGVEPAHAGNVDLEGAPNGTAPMMSLLYATATEGGSVAPYTLAYDGPDMSIYELPGGKPYFEVTQGSCSIQEIARESARVQCIGPAKLLRREAFFLGWSATVNGAAVPVYRQHDIFQSILLGAGDNDIVFTYRPPNYWLMLIVFWIGMFILLLAVAQEFVGTRDGWPKSVEESKS